MGLLAADQPEARPFAARAGSSSRSFGQERGRCRGVSRFLKSLGLLVGFCLITTLPAAADVRQLVRISVDRKPVQINAFGQVAWLSEWFYLWNESAVPELSSVNGVPGGYEWYLGEGGQIVWRGGNDARSNIIHRPRQARSSCYRPRSGRDGRLSVR